MRNSRSPSRYGQLTSQQRASDQFRQKPSREPTQEELRARAEARFKLREQQRQDAPVATREYRQAEQSLRDRTAKLRAERLARGAGKRRPAS